MVTMLASITHILPLTNICRTRILQINGRILARIGQRVKGMDIVAEAVLQPKHIQLNLQTVLGNITPGKARQMIERHLGETVAAGDIIATSGGFLRRVLRAPQAGIIDSISADQVMIRVQSQPYRLFAGIPGEIIEIIPDRGVVIETNGSLVQGAWGNDQINTGSINMATVRPGEEISREYLDSVTEGAVLVAGCCSQIDILRIINELPVKGLILGSMSAELIPIANSMKMPVIVLDGFGKTPMNGDAFWLLKSNERRDASIMALSWDSYTNERPEIIIELPAKGENQPDADIFDLGQKVRVLTYPNMGQIGTLEQIHDGLLIMPDGVRATAGEIYLENGEQLIVPLANLDIIE